MAEKKKNNNVRITTPKGVAQYPHLTTPDTKFDADGVYSVKLALGADTGEKLAQQIESEIDKSVAAAKEEKKGTRVKRADAPYQYDEEKNEYVFNFKLKAKGKTKSGEEFTQKPVIFDAKGKPVEKALKIGGGTVMKVSAEIVPFFTALVGAGVTLRLRAVQVIELHEFGGSRNAEDFGFEEEEGFSDDDDAPTVEREFSDEEADESDEDDDADF